MQQENLIKNGLDLSYLISCALHDVSCDVSRIEQMDIAQIYELAKFHSLLSISFAPLERYLSDGGSIALEEDKLKNWRNMREFLIRKNLMFDFDREKLIEFFEKNGDRNLFLATTKAPRAYHEADFSGGAVLMFGKETAGLPQWLREKYRDRCIRIPMVSEARSLNLSNSAAILAYEALRQQGFPGLLETGSMSEE